jgi:hypothetical protein
MARLCARPDCADPAVATLSYDYAARTAWIDELSREPVPSRYDLCARHADGLMVPVGWDRSDRRRHAPTEAPPGFDTALAV